MMPEGIERYACGKLRQGCMKYTRTHYADNCIFRPELPLFDQFLDPRPAHRHQRELRGNEEAVERDQHGNADQTEDVE